MIMRKIVCIALYAAMIVSALFNPISKADQNDKYWNQFRGPFGNGISLSKNLPVEFGETKNVLWKIAIHNQGWSSPVVWRNQVWLTTALEDGRELFAICVELSSGKIIHDIKVFDIENPQLEWPGQNTHATPTPLIEEGRIYVHFGTYGTACLDTKTGKILWKRRDLTCDHRVRAASSPIIDDDLLFLTFDGVDTQFIVALNKHSGETVWMHKRPAISDFVSLLTAEGVSVTEAKVVQKEKPNDHRKSYATPTIIEYRGKKQLISPAAEVTYSYDPMNGDILWRFMHPRMGYNVAGRPVFGQDLIFLTTGSAASTASRIK
jgi:outer membrane protein assembly factor BamB